MRSDDPWGETWAHFGLVIAEHRSAYQIVFNNYGKDDVKSANYIYGWYMYLAELDKIVMTYISKGVHDDKVQGYIDAQSYYENEI